MPSNDQNRPEIRVTHDIPKKQVTMRLQGVFLAGLTQMAYDRREDIPQLIKSVLEQRLMKDGYLPDWYFERKV